MTNPSENNKNQRKSVSRQTSVSNGDVNGHDMSHSHVPKTPNGDANHGNDFEIMSCPYARQTSINGIKSNGIHNGNKADISTIDENSDKIQAKKTLNYIDYLHLQSVLNSVHCLSHCDPFDVTSPPVHDEHFFIIIHQGNFMKKYFILIHFVFFLLFQFLSFGSKHFFSKLILFVEFSKILIKLHYNCSISIYVYIVQLEFGIC